MKAQIAASVARAMKRRRLTQSELARRMGTSRMVVHRMLDPADTSITLSTLSSAIVALGATGSFKLTVRT